LISSSRMRVMVANPDEHLLGVVRACRVKNATLEENSLVITCDAQDRFEILRAIKTAGGRIETFVTEEPSLEDIYMKYVGDGDVQKSQ